MSSSRYEQYETYGPTGGADATTVVDATGAAVTAGPPPGAAAPGGRHARVPVPARDTADGPGGAVPPPGSGEVRAAHEAYGAYSGSASGFESGSGSRPGSGSGHVEYVRWEPYGHGYADTYRPAYEARTPGHRAPDTPGAPASGAHRGFAEPAGPAAPTEPLLPRQYTDAPAQAGPDVHGRGFAQADTVADGSGFARADTVVLTDPIAFADTVVVTVPDRGAVRPDAGDGIRPAGGRADARRAARRKRVTDRPDALRRLLPQALVVAFLAGGTSAFVASDKAIELSVDGRPRTLHTFADDVTELLADEGVKVGAHDVVAPAPGTPLSNGDEVAVHYGRPVSLTIDGTQRRVWTTAHTVEGALRQLGVRAEGAYLSASRSQPIGRTGLELDVRTERTVTIMADGRARTIRTNAASVGEAVEAAGITLHGQDTTSVPAGSFPRDGQTVTVLRVTGTREVREERIPFEVRRTEDASLFKGTEVVERPGRFGARRVTYALRTVNGVNEKPRRIRAEVVREPQVQLVRVGTKPHPASVDGADHLNWSGLAACESGGRPGAVDPSGTYGGLYQFDTHTWQTLGGSGRPQDASAAEQTLRAKKLYVRRGASPWPHCGARLHG
ncbi:ubiquitin-like domain-containing protein [Streptomyces sp. NBC_00197]